MKTKEEILDKEGFDFPAFEFENEYSGKAILRAMEIYAKQEAIEFFKWYAMKMHGFIIYIKDIRPQVTIQEIEEKIDEFEGQSFDKLYELFKK